MTTHNPYRWLWPDFPDCRLGSECNGGMFWETVHYTVVEELNIILAALRDSRTKQGSSDAILTARGGNYASNMSSIGG